MQAVLLLQFQRGVDFLRPQALGFEAREVECEKPAPSGRHFKVTAGLDSLISSLAAS